MKSWSEYCVACDTPCLSNDNVEPEHDWMQELVVITADEVFFNMRYDGQGCFVSTIDNKKTFRERHYLGDDFEDLGKGVGMHRACFLILEDENMDTFAQPTTLFKKLWSRPEQTFDMSTCEKYMLCNPGFNGQNRKRIQSNWMNIINSMNSTPGKRRDMEDDDDIEEIQPKRQRLTIDDVLYALDDGDFKWKDLIIRVIKEQQCDDF